MKVLNIYWLLWLLIISDKCLSQSAEDGSCGCDGVKGIKTKRSLDIAPDENNLIVLEDMILSAEHVQLFNTESRIKRWAVNIPKWPNGRVRFYFNESYPVENRNVLREAWSNLSRVFKDCLTLEEIAKPEGDYIHVFERSPTECLTHVGYAGGSQTLSLGSECVKKDWIRIHEFLHAIGLYHEQSRADRDQYINIRWGNVRRAECVNFQKCVGCPIFGKYDTDSIMHYSGFSFSCNLRATIEDLQHRPITVDRKLTKADVDKVREFYGCRASVQNETK